MIDAAQGNARCPRCGKAFDCGAQDTACKCAQVQLTDALQAELQQRYVGCLCMGCLRAVQTEHVPPAS